MSPPPRAALLALALLAPLLAGCAATGPAPEPLPGPEPGPDPADPGPLWGGSPLEGVSCTTYIGFFRTSAQRVQALLPPGHAPYALATAEVAVRVSHCRSLLLDAGAPMEDAWLYLASTPLAPTPDGPDDPWYLLEAGSDRPAVLDDLAARGVPTIQADLRREGDTVTLAGPDVTYRLAGPTAATPLMGGENRDDLLAGARAEMHLVLEASSPGNNRPGAGTLEAEGGVLGRLAPAPTVPASLSHREDRFLLHTEERP